MSREHVESDPKTSDPRSSDRYTLVSQLETGRSAVIYRAKVDGVFGFEKLVALKCLSQDSSADPEARDRLIRHALICSKLCHHGIVGVYDLFQNTDGLALAMELVEGVCLDTLLAQQRKTGGPFSMATVLSLMIQILEALDHIHKARDPLSNMRLGIVFRDLRPEHMLIDRTGVVKLIGFGRAQTQQSLGPRLRGSSRFRAPELKGGARVGSKADLFSLGVLATDLLGLGPLTLHSERALRPKQEAALVRQFDALPEVYHALRPVLLKALAVSPDYRYDTAVQMLEELRPLLLPVARTAPPRSRDRDLCRGDVRRRAGAG